MWHLTSTFHRIVHVLRLVSLKYVWYLPYESPILAQYRWLIRYKQNFKSIYFKTLAWMIKGYDEICSDSKNCYNRPKFEIWFFIIELLLKSVIIQVFHSQKHLFVWLFCQIVTSRLFTFSRKKCTLMFFYFLSYKTEYEIEQPGRTEKYQKLKILGRLRRPIYFVTTE